MKAKEFYESIHTLSLECTCVEIGIYKWESLMEGAVKANKKIVEKLIKENGYIDDALFIGYNPYNHYRTKTHIIWVHSAIEHFFKIN